jgi:hypothetical protein
MSKVGLMYLKKSYPTAFCVAVAVVVLFHLFIYSFAVLGL